MPRSKTEAPREQFWRPSESNETLTSLPYQSQSSYPDAIDRALRTLHRGPLHYLRRARAGGWVVLRVAGGRKTWIPVSCRAVGLAIICGGVA